MVMMLVVRHLPRNEGWRNFKETQQSGHAPNQTWSRVKNGNPKRLRFKTA